MHLIKFFCFYTFSEKDDNKNHLRLQKTGFLKRKKDAEGKEGNDYPRYYPRLSESKCHIWGFQGKVYGQTKGQKC